jgi:hypothetical protein
MSLRKSAVAVAAALSVGSVSQPQAAVVTPPPPPATSATLGVGGGLAVGIIATVAIICIYDIWLKFAGLKNWDGTPKVQKPAQHARR